ncbi:estradiol 17-beta-dehydrogenase 8 [Patella vulgata]|uniref:estradiol 17-beta-dehydrogenase 8 n=1 Tax=Patella vulgata TaxID=6465 RepID=UPI00218007B3|nr:estradiol 17-beta-dehydrogenase 8 [Patella vulgata]
MASLRGTVVIITGASSGIGRAIAVHLAPYKPKLVLAARRIAGLKDTSLQCQDKGLATDNILIVECDVSKDDNVQNLVDKTIKTFGSIYGLVNNAGYSRMGNTEQTDMKDFDEIMRVNFRAPFYLSKLCMPYLKQSKGSVVNISSVASKKGMTSVTPYSLSKAALDSFTHLLADEIGPSGVRVNSVNPGFTRTEFIDKIGLSEEAKAEMIASNVRATPLGKIAESEDVAKLVKFLLSDESSFITGEIICIDGGRGNPVF